MGASVPQVQADRLACAREFARKYNLPVKVVVQPVGEKLTHQNLSAAYEEPGILADSGQFNNLDSVEAKKTITTFAEKMDLAMARQPSDFETGEFHDNASGEHQFP